MVYIITIAISLILRLLTRNSWVSFFIGYIIYFITKFLYIANIQSGLLNINSGSVLRYLSDSLAQFAFGFLIATLILRLFKNQKRIQVGDTSPVSTLVTVPNTSIEKNDTSLNTKLIFVQKLKDNIKNGNNWREKQRIDLLLLWVTILSTQEFEYFDSELTIDDYFKQLSLPITLRTKNKDHYLFAQEIVKSYTNIHNEKNIGGYKNCIYKPEYLLLYPKDYIKQSIDFIASHPETTKDLISNLYSIKKDLAFFVNVSENQLPSEPEENKKTGFQFIEI